MCRGLLPQATYLVVIKPVPTVLHAVPPMLGGLALVRGEGAGSPGSLVQVIRGDHGESILHRELVVGCIALVPERVQEVGEGGMVLVKKEL